MQEDLGYSDETRIREVRGARDTQALEAWLKNAGPAAGEAVNLSIVVPAYNEERRLPPTLIDMIDFFDARPATYEIIVVDDGSKDDTSGVVQKFEKIRTQVRGIRLPKNYGKGHAVRTGALNAKGELILFADADGSTPIEEVDRLVEAINSGAEVAIGSRALQSEETKVKTRFYRKVIGRVFNFLVNMFLLPGVADTQCGFKIFTKNAARFLFSNQQSDGFSFDLELLLLARKAQLSFSEVPVNWENVPGSKVNLVFDSAKMFCDIFRFAWIHRSISADDYQKSLPKEP
ncbi:MAG: glycosyltransferase family 2 protein [Bdellovibrionales bacterium]|nr:glycosyltransferase family 2 protein [Bdellovibrionales bacterium]